MAASALSSIPSSGITSTALTSILRTSLARSDSGSFTTTMVYPITIDTTSISTIGPSQSSATSSTTSAYQSPSTGGLLPNSATVKDQSADSEGLTTGAKAGIAVGIVVAAITAGLIAWFLIRRRRRRQHDEHIVASPSPAYVKRSRYDKPELPSGTVKRSNVYIPYDKPELAEAARFSPAYGNLPHGRHELSTQKMYGDPIIHQMPAQDGQMSNQMLNTTTQDSVVKQARSSSATTATEEEDINALKAREREMAQQIEIDESLQRLKAEQAALQDRIRLAEMRRRDMRGG